MPCLAVITDIISCLGSCVGTKFVHLILIKTNVMLKWTAIFLVIAIIAAIFGFTDIAAGAAGIAKIIFFIFLVLLLLSFILGATIFKK